MKKGNTGQSVFIANLKRAIAWLAILLIFFIGILGYIQQEYRFIGGDGGIRTYYISIGLELAAVLVLAALWWFGAMTTQSALRSWAEQFSFGLSLILCVIAFAAAFVLYSLYCSGISDRNGFIHELKLIYVLPSVFLGCMYLLPPKTMQKVIAPARWLFVLAAVGLTFLSCIW